MAMPPTTMPHWLHLAHTGMIRLNQTADSPAGGADPNEDSADEASQSATDADTDASRDNDAEAPTVEQLQAQLEVQRRINRNLERRTKADKKRLAALGSPTGAVTADATDAADQAPTVDQVREQVRTELNVEYAHRLATAKASAALAGKVTIDPQRAVLIMGDALKDAVDSDGAIDEQAIADAVTEMLEQNPGLKVAQGGQQFLGTADGGARKADDRSEELQLREAIAAAEKAGNFKRSIPLKQQLAALVANNKKG